MPFNGSGIYTPSAADFPAVAGTLILATKFNNNINDIATALSDCVTRDGQSPPTANLPMGGFKFTNVADGTSRVSPVANFASLGQVQDGGVWWAGTAGGTADALTLTLTPAIPAYAAGQRFAFLSSGANTTAATVAVSGLTAKAITKNGATALIAGDIPSGAVVFITYDGTQFQLSGTMASGVFLKLSGGTLTGDLLFTDASFDIGKAGATRPRDVFLSRNLAVGGLTDISGAGAGQVKFPSTQNASADANTLDDYEEGTWTPGISFGGGTTGITYSSVTGTYVKIGKQVTVVYSIALFNKGSSSGAAKVTGLPFAVGAIVSIGPCYWFGMTSSYLNIITSTDNAATTAGIFGTTTAVTSIAAVAETGFANTSTLNGSFSYFV